MRNFSISMQDATERGSGFLEVDRRSTRKLHEYPKHFLAKQKQRAWPRPVREAQLPRTRKLP